MGRKGKPPFVRPALCAEEFGRLLIETVQEEGPGPRGGVMLGERVGGGEANPSEKKEALLT